jgi:cell division protein FtsA
MRTTDVMMPSPGGQPAGFSAGSSAAQSGMPILHGPAEHGLFERRQTLREPPRPPLNEVLREPGQPLDWRPGTPVPRGGHQGRDRPPREHGREPVPEHVGVLDIGTSKIVCMIATLRSAAGSVGQTVLQPEFAGIGHQRSQGIKAGVIIDLDAAEYAVRAAVAQAERMAGVTLDDVHIGVSCGRLKSSHFTAEAKTGRGVVQPPDLARLTDAARAYTEKDGRILVHLNRLAYRLDGAAGIRDPIGMAGQSLSANLHAVTADDAPLRNLLLLAERCYLTPVRLVPTSLASALAATTEDERRLGVTLVDIGAGVTTIAVFADDHYLYTDTLAYGGGHMTFDIAKSLATPLAEAERIKAVYGTMVTAASDQREVFSYSLAGEPDGVRLASNKARLREILRPRVEALLIHVRDRLDAAGMSAYGGGRMVITGGASQVIGLAGFAADVLRRPVRIGRPALLAGAPGSLSNPAFAAVLGLVAAAADPVSTALMGARRPETASGYLGRMGQWLRESF